MVDAEDCCLSEVSNHYCTRCGRILEGRQAELPLYCQRSGRLLRLRDPERALDPYWFERQEVLELVGEFFRDAGRRVGEECIRRGVTCVETIRSHMVQYGELTREEQTFLADLAIGQYIKLDMLAKRARLKLVAIASWYRYAQRNETDTDLAQKLNWILVSFRHLDELGYDKRLCASILQRIE